MFINFLDYSLYYRYLDFLFILMFINCRGKKENIIYCTQYTVSLDLFYFIAALYFNLLNKSLNVSIIHCLIYYYICLFLRYIYLTSLLMYFMQKCIFWLQDRTDELKYFYLILFYTNTIGDKSMLIQDNINIYFSWICRLIIACPKFLFHISLLMRLLCYYD